MGKDKPSYNYDPTAETVDNTPAVNSNTPLASTPRPNYPEDLLSSDQLSAVQSIAEGMSDPLAGYMLESAIYYTLRNPNSTRGEMQQELSKYQYDPDLFEMCLKYPNMYAPQ